MKPKKLMIAVLAVVLMALVGVCGYSAYQKHLREQEQLAYEQAHIFIEDAVYPRDSTFLDLRGSGISVSHFDTLRAALPECEILWDVPFQGGYIPNDTTELTLSELTDEDIPLLDYLPELVTVHAEDCRDYPQLLTLQERRPECSVHYQVILGGDPYPENTTELTFTDGDAAELLEHLQYLPRLQSVRFSAPAMAAEDLITLRETYPQIAFSWQKEVLGTVYDHTVTELDLSGIPMESVEEIEAAMAYFPNLEKLIMCGCGIDNETMAAFRERARGSYKVVWSVQIRFMTVRTDELTFCPVKYRMIVTDEHLKDLVYCEDMLCVDIGHKTNVFNIDWVKGMPHLKYLVLADTGVSNIEALSGLKELVYLELFKTGVTDYSPLVGCTALEDVNLANTRGDASVFAQMPWLKNLWINNCGVDAETRKLLTESLPDTTIEFDSGWHMGNSWRGVENYFRMRDLLEMPYFDWGNEKGRPEWADDTGRKW